MVQWAKTIWPVSGLMLDGLAWKPLMPVRAWAMVMESRAGTSPSQPATVPAALSLASAIQPVLRTAVSRSKQRKVNPCRRWRSTTVFRASFICMAPGRALLMLSLRDGSAVCSLTGVSAIASSSSCMGISTSSMPNSWCTLSLSARLEMSQSEGCPMIPRRRPCSCFLASATFVRMPILVWIYSLLP